MKTTIKSVTLIVACLVSVVGSSLAGCHPEELDLETSELSGKYELIEVEGKRMPAQLVHGGVRLEVLEGSLCFTEDGTCKSITKFKPESGSEIRREVDATYTQDGNKVTMHWKGAGTTGGTIDGPKFTMNNEGMIFIYAKMEKNNFCKFTCDWLYNGSKYRERLIMCASHAKGLVPLDGDGPG